MNQAHYIHIIGKCSPEKFTIANKPNKSKPPATAYKPEAITLTDLGLTEGPKMPPKPTLALVSSVSIVTEPSLNPQRSMLLLAMHTLLGLRTLPFLNSRKPTNPLRLWTPKVASSTPKVDACMLSDWKFQYPLNQNMEFWNNHMWMYKICRKKKWWWEIKKRMSSLMQMKVTDALLPSKRVTEIWKGWGNFCASECWRS